VVATGARPCAAGSLGGFRSLRGRCDAGTLQQGTFPANEHGREQLCPLPPSCHARVARSTCVARATRITGATCVARTARSRYSPHVADVATCTATGTSSRSANIANQAACAGVDVATRRTARAACSCILQKRLPRLPVVRTAASRSMQVLPGRTLGHSNAKLQKLTTDSLCSPKLKAAPSSTFSTCATAHKNTLYPLARICGVGWQDDSLYNTHAHDQLHSFSLLMRHLNTGTVGGVPDSSLPTRL
jgi:hypothetical protein